MLLLLGLVSFWDYHYALVVVELCICWYCKDL